MPIFNYKCPNCNSIKRDVLIRDFNKDVKCNQCRIKMIKLVPIRVGADVFPVNGVYLEHVSPTGQTFHSKSEMRQFEKKNKMEIWYLE